MTSYVKAHHNVRKCKKCYFVYLVKFINQFQPRGYKYAYCDARGWISIKINVLIQLTVNCYLFI